METRIYCKLFKANESDTESYTIMLPPSTASGVSNPGGSKQWRNDNGFHRYLVKTDRPVEGDYCVKYREVGDDVIEAFWEEIPAPEIPDIPPRKRRISKLHLQTYLSSFSREIDGMGTVTAWQVLKQNLASNPLAADAWANALFLVEGHPILVQMLDVIQPLIDAFGIDLDHMLTTCDDPGLDILASYTAPAPNETEEMHE